MTALLSLARLRPAAIALALLAASACVSTRGGSIRVPAAQTLYVVAFVDMTREGKVGVPLAEAIQLEVYRRNPATLSMVFDDKSVALDGTVTQMEDVAIESGTRQIRIEIEAMLSNKRGGVVADLGRLRASAPYRVHANMPETERLRDEAIAAATGALAIKVTDAIDRAGSP